MEEVFQNFKHYSEWILKNWNKDEVLDSVIIEKKLMVGTPLRQLAEDEFNVIDAENFIKIPTIYESKDYEEGHRKADEEINQFDEW